MEDDLIYLIALSKVPFVGTKTAKQLIAYCGSPKNVFNAKKSTLVKIPSIGPKIIDSLNEKEALNAALKDYNYLTNNNIKVCTYLNKDYPARLKHYEDSPVILYINGNTTLDAFRTVGIVGTRQPTPYGRNFTNELISQLKDYNVQIISGLAYGIDTVAHQQCLSENIDTLAIMGTGIDSIYPPANRLLAQKISENGALISEFSLKTKADRENFPLRNRIIAALSDVVVVIQSAVKGGSLITVEYANEYNKDVFALPGRTSDIMSAGCNKMIKINKAHLLESAADIAYIMRWDSEASSAGKQKMLFAELTEDESLIVNCLKEQESATSDWIHYQTKMPLSTLAGTLLSLEFKGIVTSLPGKKYCLS